MNKENDRSTLAKLAGKALTQSIDRNEGDAATCTFVLFADTIERFDTLLMEIRHLQTNLIYFMRAPELHAALRYEESYVFGSCTLKENQEQKDWSKLFGSGRGGKTVGLADLPRLAEAFVPFLPVANDEYGFDMLNGDLNERQGDRSFPDLYDILDLGDKWRHVLAPIVRSLRRRRMTGQEDDSYGASYQVFVALQGIKRNIVHDKLHLAWYGLRAFKPSSLDPSVLKIVNKKRRQTIGQEKRADFIIARSIAAYNIREHINGLSDFYTYFEKTIDVGLQENHRPITGRRREQGMYNFMLGERARDLFIESSRVIDTLTGKSIRGDIYRGLPVFVHRWSHAFASKNRAIPSFTRGPRVSGYTTRSNHTDNEDFTKQAASYTAFTVNTSFFMPDRPDLQPIIAHEAVHCVLLELFDQMEIPTTRLSQAGALTTFWMALIEASRDGAGIANFDKERPVDMRTEIIREMLVDTVSACVTGTGYLFALFQELCGAGTEDVVRVETGREWADIASLRQTLESRAIYKELPFEWYFRLRLACDVAEKTRLPEEQTTFSQSMIDGIRLTLDDMLVRLSIIHSDSPIKGENEEYTQRIKRTARVFCDAAKQTGILDELAAIRKAGPKQSGGMVSVRPEQPGRYPIFAEEARARLIEFYVERKLANVQRPLHKAIALDFKDRIKASEFTLRAITAEQAKAQLNVARQCPLAAADAIIRFAELYLYGEEANQERSDLLGHREKLIKILDAVAIGEDREEQKYQNIRESLTNLLGVLPCFSRLGDIAWQTSFFRSLEMAAQLDIVNDDPLTTLSEDFAPGRETLQLAIEFWGFERRMSINTLAEATRLQMNMLQMPISEITNWRPSSKPQAKLDDRQGLSRTVNHVLAGTDEAVIKQSLHEIGKDWKTQGNEALAKKAQALAERSCTPDEMRAEAVAMAEEATRKWLGSDLDADFFEIQAIGMLQDAADSYVGKRIYEDDALKAFQKKVDERSYRMLREDFFKHGRDNTDDFADGEAAWGNVERLSRSLGSINSPPAGVLDEIDTLRGSLQDELSRKPTVIDKESREETDRMISRVIYRIIDAPQIAVYPDFSVSTVTIHTENPNRSIVRRLTQSDDVRRLIDDCIQCLRVFELSHLAQQVSRIMYSPRGAGLSPVADELGALQVLKLDPGYPHLVFPIQADRKLPWSKETLSALGEDPNHPLPFDECLLIEKFLRCADVRDKPAHVRALISVSAVELLESRIRSIRELFPNAFETGLEHFDKEVPQIYTRPTSSRLRGDVEFARNVNKLAHHKMETLRKAYCVEALNVQELSPLRKLVERTQPDQENGSDNRNQAHLVMKDTLRSLSRKPVGLSVFKTVYVSRQSLVDTHWWREIDTPSTRSNELEGQALTWANERLHASFYHHTPHTAEKAGAAPRDLGGRPKDVPNPPAVRRVATLGRYDFFSFSSNVVFGQQRLPLMDRSLGHSAEKVFAQPANAYSKIKQERVYRAFFMRGEFALSLALNNEPVDILAPELIHPPSKKEKDVIAILSLRLDRRSSRLAFLQRLRHAVGDWVDYRVAAKTHVDPNRTFDDVNGDSAVLEKALRNGRERSNHFTSPIFRKSVADALIRAVHHRHVDLPDLNLSDLTTDNPAAAKELIAQCGKHFGLDVTAPEQPTVIGSLIDATRLYGELPAMSVEAAGPFIQPGDAALLGEGWGDLYIVMYCDREPIGDEAARQEWLLRGVRRLYDVFALQHALFQDYSVYRTETFLRPVAIPFAATDQKRMMLSMSVRSREDRELDGVVQRVLRVVRERLPKHFLRFDHETNDEWLERLNESVTVAHVPGRNDFEFTVKNFNDIGSESDPKTQLRDRSASKALELIHEVAGAGEAAGGGGAEEILTRISFRHSVTGNLLA